MVDLHDAELSPRHAWQTAPGHAAALEGLACVAAARADGTRAGQLLGAAAAWRAKRHRPLTRLEAVDATRAERSAWALAGNEAFEDSYASGAAEPGSPVDEGARPGAASRATPAAGSAGPDGAR